MVYFCAATKYLISLRFLQGDYCLESDLTEPAKTFIPPDSMQFPSDLFDFEDSDSGKKHDFYRKIRRNVFDG